MSAFWIVLLSVTAGTAISRVLACLPGLHIYNVMWAMVLGILAQAAAGKQMEHGTRRQRLVEHGLGMGHSLPGHGDVVKKSHRRACSQQHHQAKNCRPRRNDIALHAPVGQGEGLR